MTATLSQRLVVLFAFIAGPVGVLAPKGIVVVVAVAGLAGLVRWAGDGFPRLPLRTPFIATLAALTLWAAITSAWAFMPDRVLILVLRLTMLAVAGAGLLYAIARLDVGHREKTENALLAGMLAGLAILAAGFIFAKITGDSLWDTYFFDPLTTLNNGAVAVSLLAWPAFAILSRRGRTKTFLLIGGLAYLGLMFLSSGAALLAPVAGLVGFLTVRFSGRRGALALAAVITIMVLAAPQIASSFLSANEVEKIATELPPSARHRLAMWSFAVEKIDEKPIWGWGMDASRAIPQDDRRLAPNMEIMPLHPHNAFLQVRLELGVPGAVLVAALVGIFFAGVGRVSNHFAASVIAGAGMAYLTVAALSYGVWQNWWLAFAWALAALTSLVLRPSSSGG